MNCLTVACDGRIAVVDCGIMFPNEPVGVEVIGPFPGDLQIITIFSAALDAKATSNEPAKAFIKFISAPAAAAAYKAKGLDPG